LFHALKTDIGALEEILVQSIRVGPVSAANVTTFGELGKTKIAEAEAELGPQGSQFCLGGVILPAGVVQLPQVSLGMTCGNDDGAQRLDGFALALLFGAAQIAKPLTQVFE
jgi:hypothetical protein